MRLMPLFLCLSDDARLMPIAFSKKFPPVGHCIYCGLMIEQLPTRPKQPLHEKSSIDLALKDAFRKMRAFLTTTKGLSEDEAISLISIAVDFGVTQVVDGNWGIHAIIKKSLFAGALV